MPVKRRRPKERNARLCLEFEALLFDEPLPDGANAFALFSFEAASGPLWVVHRSRVLTRWVAMRPGTRPSLWWKHEAPQVPRQRVGGVGEQGQDTEILNRFRFPELWASVDPTNPPRFESQAAYLKRQKLLFVGETERLRPGALRATEPLPRQLWPMEALLTSEEEN